MSPHLEDVLFIVTVICLSVHNNTKTRFFNILKKFSTKKNGNFQIKKSDIFHIFAQKHRLWVLIRTASPGWF